METFVPNHKEVHGPILPEFVLNKEITFGAKVTYALLCDYACCFKEDNSCPSHSTLAKRLSCSVTSIKNYLSELTGANLIGVEYRVRQSNRYYMLRPDHLKDAECKPICHQPETVHQPELTCREPEVDRQQPEFASPRPKVGYRNNLNKQQENTTPPFPPIRPEQRKVSAAPKAPAAGGVSVFSPDFEKAWELYPKKENRGFAWSAWRKLKRCGQLPPLDEILAIIRRLADSDNWRKENGRFIPQFSKWIYGHRWLDPIPPAEAKEMQRRQELSQVLQAQEEQEKRRQEQRNAEKARVRPLFEAFAAKFATPRSEGLDAMASGTWMHLRSINAAPLASDVPADNSLGIIEFLKAFRRQHEEARNRAAYREPQPERPDARASEPKLCGDILRSHPVFSRFFPETPQLQQAV